MPVLSYPGVYIEELPSGSHTITGVSTSITAFIGAASRGPNLSIELIINNEPVDSSQITVMDLSNWQHPTNNKIAIDPQLGRIAFPVLIKNKRKKSLPLPQQLEVNYCYAFSADMGGGPYNRQATLDKFIEPIIVTKNKSLQEAIEQWLKGAADGIIQIEDNATYEIAGQTIHTTDKRKLVIQASDGYRPCIRLTDDLILGSNNELSITLNGLLIDGRIKIQQNIQLNIIHSTLVPKYDYSLSVDSNASDPGNNSRITIDHSIVGTLLLPDNIFNLTIRDSIVDGLGKTAIAADSERKKPGPSTQIERSTLFGASHVIELPLASEIISTEPVIVERLQDGCIRYSYFPLSSVTPPRYRCQPELDLIAHFNNAKPLSALVANQTNHNIAITLNSLVPKFTSTTYGDPGYAQLSEGCNSAITTGAEDGSEMGVFQHSKQSQRKEQLTKILDEYLPYYGGTLIIEYVN